MFGCSMEIVSVHRDLHVIKQINWRHCHDYHVNIKIKNKKRLFLELKYSYFKQPTHLYGENCHGLSLSPI